MKEFLPSIVFSLSCSMNGGKPMGSGLSLGLSDLEGERPEEERGRGLLSVHCLHGDGDSAESKDQPCFNGSFSASCYL